METVLYISNSENSVKKKEISQGNRFIPFPVNPAAAGHAQNARPMSESLGMAGRSMGERIAAGYADLVKRYDEQWDWFGTFTFEDDICKEVAGKIWKKFTHKINREVFGCRYYRRKGEGIIWVRGSEYQKRGYEKYSGDIEFFNRPGLHLHALLGKIPDRVRRLNYMDCWKELAGISRIQLYERGKGAEQYIAKNAYAFKKGEVDFSDTLADRSLSMQVELPYSVA